jgi:hypothetical protein
MSSKHRHYQARQSFSAALSRLCTDSANFQGKKSHRIQLKVMSEVERGKKDFSGYGRGELLLRAAAKDKFLFTNLFSQLAIRGPIYLQKFRFRKGRSIL